MDITRRRNVTAALPSPLLRNSTRFEDLGYFDEEECRFFLREVGERVVPVYPFSFGMEEVYSLILERYGYAGLSDATSVLQDLLESDLTAGGLGDDGDVWRSWRHSWRHRNADALNPFIPKIGNFILQHPTLPHIRKIKALNFIRKTEDRQKRHQARKDEKAEAASKRQALYDISPNQNRVSSAPAASSVKQQSSDQENLSRLPATTYSHQRQRTLLSSSGYSPPTLLLPTRYSPPTLLSPTVYSPSSARHDAWRPTTARRSVTAQQSSEGFSQQQFVELDRTLREAYADPSLLLTFEMLSSDRAPEGEDSGSVLRRVPGETVTLQQVSSCGSTASNKQEKHLSSSPLPRIKSSPLRIFSFQTPQGHVNSDASARSSRVFSEPLQVSSREQKHGSGEREKSVERLRKLSDSLRPFARRPAGDNSERSKRIRADNRQVRILDGVLLNPKVRKRLSSPPSTSADDDGRVDERKKSAVRRSLTPVWQKRDSSRTSWKDLMRNFFRTEASSTQSAKQSKRESSNLSQSVVTPSVAPPDSHTINKYLTQSTAREQPSQRFGLDGTFDLPTSNLPTFAPKSIMSRFFKIDQDKPLPLNKPLPLSPPAIARSLSAHPGFPSSHQLRQDKSASFNGGTISGDGTYSFHSLTAHALQRNEIPGKHQLLPVYHELAGTSGHRALEPPKKPSLRISQLTYSSVENANPFANNLNTPNRARLTYSSVANANPFDFETTLNTPIQLFKLNTHSLPTQRVKLRNHCRNGITYPSPAKYDPFASIPDPIPRPRAPKPILEPVKQNFALTLQASGLNPKASVFTPFKNFMHKRSQSKDVNTGPFEGRSPVKQHARQASLGKLSSFIKSNLRTQESSEVTDDFPATAQAALPSFPVVSLRPNMQALVLGQIEFILNVVANEFLLDAVSTKRLKPDVVMRLAAGWKAKHLPPVVDFMYDGRTQYALVISNGDMVKFGHEDRAARNAAITAWDGVVTSLAARVLCLSNEAIMSFFARLPAVLTLLRARDAHHAALRDLHLKVMYEVGAAVAV